jgi:hypothetical protein
MIQEQNSWKLYSQCIDEFNYQYSGDLLSEEHMAQADKVHFTKFFIPGVVDEDGKPEATNYEFWGYHFIKDGQNYLIKSQDEQGREINIKELLPIKAENLLMVADSQGTKHNVYYVVNKPVPKRIPSEKCHTPKEFIDNLCLLKHSKPEHQKLMYMMALSQLWDRSYYRISSVAGAGKDNTVDTCMGLFGNCGTIESPTIAKLEDRATVLKWLVCNEVVDIEKAAWDIIQQFLLTAGARKNKITKHSRAFKNVQEIIDVRDFSLSMFYNDIDHYPDAKTGLFKPYFDDTTKKAVRDRFPAFRFYGGFTENFNSMSRINIKKFVEDNFDWYVDMVKSFTFYKENFHDYLNNWSEEKLMEFKGRDATNMGVLLKIVDFYCESQEEFDKWMIIINEAVLDYITMLDFPKTYKKLIKRFEKVENTMEGPALRKAQKEHREQLKGLKDYHTFKEKIEYMEDLCKGIVTQKGKAKDTEVDYSGALDFSEDIA